MSWKSTQRHNFGVNASFWRAGARWVTSRRAVIAQRFLPYMTTFIFISFGVARCRSGAHGRSTVRRRCRHRIVHVPGR